MPFRRAVLRALSEPLGGTLASLFAIPAVTAIVADGEAAEIDRLALAELTAAMVRAGVQRGRMFVLLTATGPATAARRESARELRALLGLPVIAHDPALAAFEPGRLANGLALALDDELREAEAVVVCGRFGAGPGGDLHGGPAALLPGLAASATRAAFAAGLPVTGGPHARAAAALALAREVLDHVPIDFALVWSGEDPPRVRAGEGRTVFEACVAEGWAAPPTRSRGVPRQDLAP